METDMPVDPPSVPLAIPLQEPQPQQQQAAGPSRRKGRGRRKAVGQSREGAQPAAETDEEDQQDSDAGAGTPGNSDGDDYIDTSDDDTGPPPPPDELYDPEADDQDEKWMDDKRQGRVSDAILSCPGCFTTLCIDCQQHHTYTNQYRAMFVMHCEVDTDKWVGPTTIDEGALSGKKRPLDDTGGGGKPAAKPKEECIYHPVLCETCETQVGVFDPIESTYVFFNVFPSNA